MKFKVDKKIPLSIKEQLKGQIRAMISSELLLPGQSLPSCSDMASILSINRNTVATVYAELSSEGVLTSNRGAGTVVRKAVITKGAASLSSVLDEAVGKARKMGFTNEQITDHFFNILSAHTSNATKTILMVWCNHLTIKEVGETLESKLGVTIKSLLVEEIQQHPEQIEKELSGVDLVVTSLNYIDSILPFASKLDIEVAGIILTPVGRVLNEIVRLPEGTNVGFVCVNNLAAKSTCKGVHLSGNISLNTIWAGADDSKRLKQLIADCDVIFATHHVYDQVIGVSGNTKKVIHLDLSLSEANLNIITECLVKA